MYSDLFNEIAEVGEYDYSWHIGKLLRRKEDGQLLFAAASGCSCYGYWDNIESDDLQPVETWQQAVEIAKKSFTEGEVANFVASLMELPADCST